MIIKNYVKFFYLFYECQYFLCFCSFILLEVYSGHVFFLAKKVLLLLGRNEHSLLCIIEINAFIADIYNLHNLVFVMAHLNIS